MKIINPETKLEITEHFISGISMHDNLMFNKNKISYIYFYQNGAFNTATVYVDGHVFILSMLHFYIYKYNEKKMFNEKDFVKRIKNIISYDKVIKLSQSQKYIQKLLNVNYRKFKVSSFE